MSATPPTPARSIAALPGPGGVPYFGNVLQFRPARMHLQLEDWARRYGTPYRLRLIGRDMLVIADAPTIAELLLPAATVAFQTLSSWPKAGKVATESRPDRSAKKPHFIDGCRAWASDGPVVERLFPLHYRKPG